MKCPKCSYTSFDYLDACKRCGTDLRDTRTLLQIIAVSPEERAPAAPPAGRAAAEAPAPPRSEQPEFGAAAPAEGSELLEGLDFDESFEGLVERTSYEEEAKPKPADAQDELLDLDFGDIFGDEGKKK